MTFYNIGSYSNNNYYNSKKDLDLEKEKALEEAKKEEEALKDAQLTIDNIENEIKSLTPEELENKLKEQKALYLNSLNNYFFVLSDKSKEKVQETMLNIIEEALEKKEVKNEETDTKEETIKLTSPAEIISYLSNADIELLNTIKEEIGDISEVGRIEISPSGEITIISDNVEIVADSSGSLTITKVIDCPTIPEQDTVVEETTPEISTPTTDETTESTEETATETTEETTTETTTEETEDTTEETTTETTTETTESDNSDVTTGNNDDSSSSNIDEGTSTGESTTTTTGSGDLQAELDSLVQEKEETQTDLSQQQDNLEATESEKDATLGEIDSNIETEEGNLDNANTEVDSAQSNVDSATQEVEQAQSEVNSTQDTKDTAKGELDSAVENVNDATETKDTKEATKEEKVTEEETAKTESETANDELATATNNTNEAQTTSNEKNQQLSVATGERTQAFSVLNQANSQVASAQREYNNAQAKATSFIENAWNKFKSWVSSALSKLEAAITKRDAAEIEAEKKQQKEEEAKVASDEALEELNNRIDEQQTAQDVADAAQVVLDKKTGEREVSEQEYADALIVLADAMDAKESANGEYNSALEDYMAAKEYKVDADGNLVNAEGELVSAQDVVKDLEGIVCNLCNTRKQEETSYNNVLNNIEGVIKNDENKIKQLDSEIKNVREKIKEEEERIALQEAMIAQMAQDKSEYYAQEATDGIWDDIVEGCGYGSVKDKQELDKKQALLEKALLSGNQEEIMAAYAAIYGSSEVIVDASGNIVTDTSTLSEDELAKCTMTTVNALNTKNLNTYAKSEAEKMVEAQNMVEYMNYGCFTFNGQTITTEDITNILLAQNADLNKQQEDARNQQGWLSQSCSGLNAQLGFGTTSMEMESQVAMQKALIEELNNCKNPSEYAAKFQAITGQPLNGNSITMLLAYQQAQMPESKQTAKVPTEEVEGTFDFSETVNSVTKEFNSNKDYSINSLSLLNNSTAVETIEDYKETQTTLKETANGVITGVVTAAAVAAAPFTGGASLAFAAVVGAGTSLALSASDGFYDKDNDGVTNFNYTWQEALKDTFTGALNGLIGTFSNGIGTKLTSFISGKLTSTTISTTLNQTLKNTLGTITSKAVGNTVEGVIDGGLSSSTDYLYRVATDENLDFSFEEFTKTTLTGMGFGGTLNLGLGLTTDLLGAGVTKIKNLNLENQINDVLQKGLGDNQLANVLANKLDTSLLTPDGMVNHYAVNQLRQYATDACASLKTIYKKAGLDTNGVYKALDNVSLQDMQNLPKVLSALSQPELQGIKATLNTEEGINTFLANLDDINIDPKTGKLTSFTIKNGDETFTYSFDNKGNITNGVKIDANGNESDISIKPDDVEIKQDLDTSTTTVDPDTKTKTVKTEQEIQITREELKTKVQEYEFDTTDLQSAIEELDDKQILVIKNLTDNGIDLIESYKSIIELSSSQLDDFSKLYSKGVRIDTARSIVKSDNLEYINKYISTFEELQKIGISNNNATDFALEIVQNQNIDFIPTFKRLKEIGFDDIDSGNIARKIELEHIDDFLYRYNTFIDLNLTKGESIILARDLITPEIDKFKTIKNLAPELRSIHILNLITNYRYLETDEFYETALRHINKYNDLINDGIDALTAETMLLKPDSPMVYNYELNKIKYDPTYTPIENGFLDRIGKDAANGITICSVENVSEVFANINAVKIGPRIDKNIENWTIKIGDTDVRIRTDNNYIFERNITPDIDLNEVFVITPEHEAMITDAILTMQKTGRELPEEIYLTSLFSPVAELGNTKAAGVFQGLNPNKIFIESKIAISNPEYAKEVIYHEAAHMSDFNLEKDWGWISGHVTNTVINLDSKIIGTPTNKVNSEDVIKYISNYALTNEKEYVAEITTLITKGTIYIDKNGKYAIKTDHFGQFKNAKWCIHHWSKYSKKAVEALQNIMNLYMELTEGKIAIPERIG